MLRHGDVIECHNRPGPPECRLALAYEYTTRTILMFRPRANGDLALDTVLFVDGGSISERSFAQQEDFVWSRYEALHKTNCAGNPDTSPSAGHGR